MKHLIALVGLCGSGKSVAADFFQKEKIPGVYFGKLTLEELEKRGLPVNEENEKKFREDLRRQYGMAAYAVLSLEKIRRLSEKYVRIYIDGLYSWDEYKVLRKEYGEKLILIGLHTDKALRYARLSQRSVRPLTREQAEGRDLSEIEQLAKGGPIAFADHLVVNNGSVDELAAKISGILAALN